MWTRRRGSFERDCKRTGGVLADIGMPSLYLRLIDMTGVSSSRAVRTAISKLSAVDVFFRRMRRFEDIDYILLIRRP